MTYGSFDHPPHNLNLPFAQLVHARDTGSGAVEQNDEKLNGTKVRTKESFPNTFTGMCVYDFDGIKTNDRETRREEKKN